MTHLYQKLKWKNNHRNLLKRTHFQLLRSPKQFDVDINIDKMVG